MRSINIDSPCKTGIILTWKSYNSNTKTSFMDRGNHLGWVQFFQRGSLYFNFKLALKYKFRAVQIYGPGGTVGWVQFFQRGSLYFKLALKYKFRAVQLFRNIWTGGNRLGWVQFFRDRCTL